MIPFYLMDRFGLEEATIHISLPYELSPPSVNKMYTAGRYGNLQLKSAGRRYLNELKQAVAERMQTEVPRRWLYHFFMIVCVPRITNSNFVEEAERAVRNQRPMKTTTRVKNKKTGLYEERPAFTSLIKNKDADGPLKKVQDVFFDVLGLDDRLAVTSTGARARSDVPGIHLLLVPLTEKEVLEQVDVDKEVLDLWTP